mmetsp:Transcript_68734/g.121459  ORF Transcript_68734/g.121459 Transcript_68734/m.121459 type:complete len:471 (-) Transcript_68734:1536-2948(-)
MLINDGSAQPAAYKVDQTAPWYNKKQAHNMESFERIWILNATNGHPSDVTAYPQYQAPPKAHVTGQLKQPSAHTHSSIYGYPVLPADPLVPLGLNHSCLGDFGVGPSSPPDPHVPLDHVQTSRAASESSSSTRSMSSYIETETSALVPGHHAASALALDSHHGTLAVYERTLAGFVEREAQLLGELEAARNRLHTCEADVTALRTYVMDEVARLERELAAERQQRSAEQEAHGAEVGTLHKAVMTMQESFERVLASIQLLEAERPKLDNSVSATDMQFLDLKAALVGLSQRQENFQAQISQLHNFFEPKLTDMREMKFEIDLLKRRFDTTYHPPPVQPLPPSKIPELRATSPLQTATPAQKPLFTSLLPPKADAALSPAPSSLRYLEIPPGPEPEPRSALFFTKPVVPPAVITDSFEDWGKSVMSSALPHKDSSATALPGGGDKAGGGRESIPKDLKDLEILQQKLAKLR